MERAWRGVVVSYDVDRGFGFIRSREIDEDVFVHVSTLKGPARTLRPGQRVRFAVEPDARGPRAVWVEVGPAGAWPGLALPPGQAAALTLAGVVALATLGLAWFGGVPWVAAYLGAINAATLALYAWDKHRAVRGRRRVPELALLGLALAGGTPAAALAVATLRHKTRKPAFLAALAAVAAAQGIALALWRTRG